MGDTNSSVLKTQHTVFAHENSITEVAEQLLKENSSVFSELLEVQEHLEDPKTPQTQNGATTIGASLVANNETINITDVTLKQRKELTKMANKSLSALSKRRPFKGNARTLMQTAKKNSGLRKFLEKDPHFCAQVWANAPWRYAIIQTFPKDMEHFFVHHGFLDADDFGKDFSKMNTKQIPDYSTVFEDFKSIKIYTNITLWSVRSTDEDFTVRSRENSYSRYSFTELGQIFRVGRSNSKHYRYGEAINPARRLKP